MSNGTFYRAGVIGLLLVVGWLVGCGREHHGEKPSPSERLLFSFERRTMLPLYGGTASRTIVPEHATHGKHALRLKLGPKRETVILSMGGFPSDWRGWRTLKVDVYRDGGPLTVNLRISDVHGKRHWIWSTRISPGANTLVYDIPSLQGKVDLSAVAELMWYAEQPEGVIYLDHVRLSRTLTHKLGVGWLQHAGHLLKGLSRDTCQSLEKRGLLFEPLPAEHCRVHLLGAFLG